MPATPANDGARPFQPPAPWFNHPAVSSPGTALTVYTDSGTGTLTLSGGLVEAAVYTDTVSGTLTLSGAKTEAWTNATSPAGTLTLTGSSTDAYGVIYKDSPTGTITLTGSCTDAVTFRVSTAGTVSLTGSSTDSYVVTGPTRSSLCDLELEQGGLLELENESGFLALEVCVAVATGSSAQAGRTLEGELYALLRNDDEVAALFAGVMA